MSEFSTEWRAGQNEFAMEICETNIVHIDWERSAFLKAWCSFNRSWCINRYCWLFSKSFYPLNICYFINSGTNEPNIDWLWELNWQVNLKASANKPYTLRIHQVHNNQVALVQREMMSLKLIPFPCGWGVGCSPMRSYYILCLVIPLLYLSFYLCYTIGSPDFVLLTHVWCGFKLERAIVYNDIRIPKSYCPGKYCYLLFTSFVWKLSAEINKTAHSDKIPELFDWYKSLCICRLLWHRSHWTSFV